MISQYALIDGAAVWALSATHGLPLEFVLAGLADRKLLPIWQELLRAAQRDGANLRRLTNRLQDVAGDVYPPDDAAAIKAGLELLLQLKEFKQ